MMRNAYVFVVAFAIASCKSKSYNYIQIDRDSFSNTLVKREVKEIEAESDSEAYVEAYQYYCISKYANKYRKEAGEINIDSSINFELLNDEGENIKNKILFLNKNFIEEKIDKESSERINLLIYGVESKPIPNSKLSENTYQIIVQDIQSNVEDHYVLIKNKELNKKELGIFVDVFRKEYCKNKCNIYLYDTVSVRRLVNKYPLDDEEYLNLADHFIAESIFEIPELNLFPYQDAKYKELGGKHYRKQFVK